MKTKHCFLFIFFLALLIQVNGSALAQNTRYVKKLIVRDGTVTRNEDFEPVLEIWLNDGTYLESPFSKINNLQIEDDIKINLKLNSMEPSNILHFNFTAARISFSRFLNRRDSIVRCEWSFRDQEFTSNVIVKGQIEKLDVYTVAKGSIPSILLKKDQPLNIKITRDFSDGTQESYLMDSSHNGISLSMEPDDWIELNMPEKEPWSFSPIADRADNLVKLHWSEKEWDKTFYVERKIIVDTSRPKVVDMGFEESNVECSHAGKKFSVFVLFDQHMKTEEDAFTKLELEYREGQWIELKLTDFVWGVGFVNIDNSEVKFNIELPVPGIDDQIFLRPRYRLSQMSGLGEKDYMETYVKESGYLPVLHLRPSDKTYIFLGKEKRVYKPGEQLEGWYNIHNYNDNYEISFYRLNGNNLAPLGSRKAGKCTVIGYKAPPDPGKYLIRIEHSYVDANGKKITEKVVAVDYEVVQNN